MKITLHIEMDSAAELARFGAALAGVPALADTSTAAAPAAPAAATRQRTAKADAALQPSAAPAAQEPAPSTAAPAVPETTGITITGADLTAAANAAVAKLGASGVAKTKAYVAANFTRADGTPGTLLLTDAAQRPALLAALQKIGTGELSI